MASNSENDIPAKLILHILGNLLFHFPVILKIYLGMSIGETMNFDKVLAVIKSEDVQGKCCTSSAGWIFDLSFSAIGILLLNFK